MSAETIMVTGAAGLIGRRVLEMLRAGGRRTVGVDITKKNDASADILIADVADTHRLHSIVGSEQVGAIVHCGAVSGPMVMIDNPYGIVQANIVGTANVLELARIHRMRRIVFCSSNSAYGPMQERPVDAPAVAEDVVLRPSSVYAATKVAGELLLAAYKKQHGVDGIAIRLSWVYGPGRTTDCFIRTLIEDAQAGRTTRIAWGKNFPRQFIHVDDAARALLAALDADGAKSTVYNATGGTFLTLNEIAQLVASIHGNADIELADGSDPLDDYQHRLDISAIGQDLGFVPQISLEDGIRSYSGWLKLNSHQK